MERSLTVSESILAQDMQAGNSSMSSSSASSTFSGVMQCMAGVHGPPAGILHNGMAETSDPCSSGSSSVFVSSSSSSSSSSTGPARPWADGLPADVLPSILAQLPQQQRLMAAAAVSPTWAAAAAAATHAVEIRYSSKHLTYRNEQAIGTAAVREDVPVNKWLEKHGSSVKSMTLGTAAGSRNTIVRVMPPFTCLPNLQALKLRGWIQLPKSAVVQLTTACPQLNELHIEGCSKQTNKECLQALASIVASHQSVQGDSSSSQLQQQQGVQANPAATAATAAAGGVIRLKMMFLTNFQFDSGELGTMAPAFARDLQTLRLHSCAFGSRSQWSSYFRSVAAGEAPAPVNILAGLGDLTGLHNLRISSVEGNWPYIADLADLRGLSDLKTLDMLACPCTTVVCGSGSPSRGILQQLQRLMLSCVQQLQGVSLLRGLTNLTRLELVPNRYLSVEDAALLTKYVDLMPDLKRCQLGPGCLPSELAYWIGPWQGPSE